MIDGYGPNSSALSDPSSQLGYLLRTFLASSHWASMAFYLTWRLRATKRKRLYFQLQPLARPISANVFSSSPAGWATPRAEGFDAGAHPGTMDSLHAQVKTWASATGDTVSDRTKPYAQGGIPLTVAVHTAWPTPIANNAKGYVLRKDGTPYPNRTGGPELVDAVRHWPTPVAGDGQRESVQYARGNPTLKGAAVWPTPTASEGNGVGLHGDGAPDLRTALWLTPCAGDENGGKVARPGATNTRKNAAGVKQQLSLKQQVKEREAAWYSPVARDHKGEGRRAQLGTQVAQAKAGKLNPDWVEQLMGYPLGWTLLEESLPSRGRRSRTSRSTNGKRRAPRTEGNAIAASA
jgi:hypothetical protein